MMTGPGHIQAPQLWLRQRLLDERSPLERAEADFFRQLCAFLGDCRDRGRSWHLQRWVALRDVLECCSEEDEAERMAFAEYDARWPLQYVVTGEQGCVVCALDIDGTGWRRGLRSTEELEEKRALMHSAGLHYAHIDLDGPGIGVDSVCRYIANRADMGPSEDRGGGFRRRERLLQAREWQLYAQALLPAAQAHGDEVFMRMRLDGVIRADRGLRRRLAGGSFDFVIAGSSDTAIRCAVGLCGEAGAAAVRRRGESELAAAAAADAGLRLVQLGTDADAARAEALIYA